MIRALLDSVDLQDPRDLKEGWDLQVLWALWALKDLKGLWGHRVLPELGAARVLWVLKEKQGIPVLRGLWDIGDLWVLGAFLLGDSTGLDITKKTRNSSGCLGMK